MPLRSLRSHGGSDTGLAEASGRGHRTVALHGGPCRHRLRASPGAPGPSAAASGSQLGLQPASPPLPALSGCGLKRRGPRRPVHGGAGGSEGSSLSCSPRQGLGGQPTGDAAVSADSPCGKGLLTVRGSSRHAAQPSMTPSGQRGHGSRGALTLGTPELQQPQWLLPFPAPPVRVG